MKYLLSLALVAMVWVGAQAPTYAQTAVSPCTQDSAAPYRNCVPVSAADPLPTTAGATSAEGAAIAPVSIASATPGLVLKTSAGNLYSLQVTNAATGGYVLLLDRVTVPSNGAVIPLKCEFFSGAGMITRSYSPPLRFSSGLVVLFSSTGCFTFTAATPSFISGEVK